MQYEIIAGGGGARASKDGASATTVNQSNARIAPIEIIESEFPTRLVRFELIRDSGGAGTFRGGLGVRREYLNLAEARFSIRSMKHVIPPNGMEGGRDGRPGDIWINPETDRAKRLPTRYADYPLRGGRYFPPRYAGRRRLRRSAGAAGRARARRRARRICFAGGGGARIRRRADGGSSGSRGGTTTEQRRSNRKRRARHNNPSIAELDPVSLIGTATSSRMRLPDHTPGHDDDSERG